MPRLKHPSNGNSFVPILIFLVSLAVLILVPSLYGLQYPKSVSSVFDDVVTYGKLSALVGFMSDLGITLWMTMAVLMAHAWHRRLQQKNKPLIAEEKWFYISSIAVLLLLALDDRLLIHEWLNEEKGVPKRLIMGAYGAVVVAWGLRFSKYLLGRSQAWLWAALFAFCVSEAVDLNYLSGLLNRFFSVVSQDVIEEGTKWVGICALFLHIFTLTTDLSDKSP